MEPSEAKIAIRFLEERREELSDVISGFSNIPVTRNRFDRWKERTVATIRDQVSEEEAEKFRDTYVPMVWAQGDEAALRDEIVRHDSALFTLVEELTKHPQSIPRGVRSEMSPQTAQASPDVPTSREPDPRTVWVIHGRDLEARDAIFGFLRDLDLRPYEWEEMVSKTGRGSPYNAEVVKRAFGEAQAVIALFTPDDEARLHPDLQEEDEPEHERELTGQARPNVFIEAGMALQAQPERTILVEIGHLRSASDLEGMNAVRMGNEGALLALVQRLRTAHCAVNDSNPKWMNAERFRSLRANTRRPKKNSPAVPEESLPVGHRLGAGLPNVAPPLLTAQLLSRGRDYLLEVVNRGGVTMKNVRWELPEDVQNWHILEQVLDEYPIPEMPPRDHIRVPVAVSLGSVMVKIRLLAELEDGSSYENESRLSVYD